MNLLEIILSIGIVGILAVSLIVTLLVGKKQKVQKVNLM